MELGVTDPVPAFNAPALPHQLQQCFWGDTHAGVAPRGALHETRQMGGLKWIAVTAAGGAHLHDPVGAAPCRADVLWSLF